MTETKESNRREILQCFLQFPTICTADWIARYLGTTIHRATINRHLILLRKQRMLEKKTVGMKGPRYHLTEKGRRWLTQHQGSSTP